MHGKESRASGAAPRAGLSGRPADGDPVIIYTDGACLGNPGPGGWGAVLLYQGHRREISGGHRKTTNNRMEMLAVIKALEYLKRPGLAEVYTDSRYLHDAVNMGWLARWQRNGWRTADKKAVKNKDLWLRLDALLQEHEVSFCWVRGHHGNAENERCDRLAGEAALGENLPEDEGYVSGGL